MESSCQDKTREESCLQVLSFMNVLYMKTYVFYLWYWLEQNIQSNLTLPTKEINRRTSLERAFLSILNCCNDEEHIIFSFAFCLTLGILCIWKVNRNTLNLFGFSLQFDLITLQGDILFLTMSEDPIRAGEIIVFNVEVSPSLHYLSISHYVACLFSALLLFFFPFLFLFKLLQLRKLCYLS